MPITFLTTNDAKSELEYVLVRTAWRPIVVAGAGQTVLHVTWGESRKGRFDARAALHKITSEMRFIENRHFAADLQAQLIRYFAGGGGDFDCQVAIGYASAFGQKVLRCCAKIPFGTTASYGELALRAGLPRAARAVGSVMARNRVPILIPCHRVVGVRGGLGGYSGAGGIAAKRALLDLERSEEPGGVI